MEEKINIHLYAPESQELFGERDVKITAIIKDAEKIVQQTDGKVYFTDEGLDYRSGYFDAKDEILENFKELAIAQVKKTREKEVTIYPEQLNWVQIRGVIKECEEKIRREEEQEIIEEPREKEITISPEELGAQISKAIEHCEEKIRREEEQEKVKQIDTMLRQKFKHIKVYRYNNEVIFTIYEPIKKLKFRDYDDLLQKISELTEEEVMLESIQKLQEKCEELEKRCKEKIYNRYITDIKRYHEEDEEGCEINF